MLYACKQWGYGVIQSSENNTSKTFPLAINFTNIALLGLATGASLEPKYCIDTVTLTNVTVLRTEHTAGQANVRWFVIGR